MIGRSFVIGAFVLVAACKDKPTTTLTLTGDGVASGAVATDLADLFEQLTLGKPTTQDSHGSELIVRMGYALPPDDRGRLDGLLSKLGRGKVRSDRVTLTVDVDPAMDDPSGKPEHFVIRLDPSGAKRTLRSTGSVGGEQMCSWEVAMNASLPDRVTTALANSQFVADRPYHVSTDDPDLKPLVDRIRFLQRDRVSFAFGEGVDATPSEYAGTASPEQFRACSSKIFENAEPWFLCTLVFPSLCGWMKSHELVDR